MTDPSRPLRILALGGSTTPQSASERALRIAAASAERDGVTIDYLTSRDLMVPIYDTESHERGPEQKRLVEAMRTCDGMLIATPGYHGSFSGMIKNALDYAEDLRTDERPYLADRAVGLITVAHGWQTAVGTLGQLRQIIHSLRAWPTPLGCAINDASGLIGADAAHSDADVVRQLEIVGAQVAQFAHSFGGR